MVAALRETPTLVVLEDLTGREALSPLLRTLPCLLLLASRTTLPYPELPKLLAEGRLVHLRAPDLAFTEEEARALFGGKEGWQAAHRATGGWPLPLFLATLTGRPPEPGPLLQGLMESLSEAEFKEGLLLAALPALPLDQAVPATEALFQKGLLQRLPQGYRLHPLLKEMALRTLGEEVRQAVREAEGRLSPELLAEAYHQAGLHPELLALLERPLTLRIPAERLLAWQDLLRGGGERTRLRLGEALLQAGKREGVPLLEALAASPDPGVALIASGHLAYYLADPLLGQDLGAARAHLERGLALLDQVPPELAGRFLNDAARVPWEEGRPEEAVRLLQEALNRLSEGSPYRLAPLTNLAFLRFEQEGALLGRIAALEEAVRLGGLGPANLPGNLRDLGRLYLLLGRGKRPRPASRRQPKPKGAPLRPWRPGCSSPTSRKTPTPWPAW